MIAWLKRVYRRIFTKQPPLNASVQIAVFGAVFYADED